MNPDRFKTPGPTWLHLYAGPAVEFEAELRALDRDDLRVRCVRGGKMRNKADLLDEFAAALQFPCVFGGNWNSFADCLYYEGPATLVVGIFEARKVLKDGSSREGSNFWRILSEVAQTEPASRLHVVLQVETADRAKLQ
ncbi:MAG TPA: barstar family protein, partial [Gemmatales bacterium]|nr:barstar family protein [Gemmatales bacterium]